MKKARLWRSLGWLLILVGLPSAVWLMGRMGRLSQHLRLGPGRFDILDWELAFTPARAAAVLADWRGADLGPTALASLQLDWLFIAAYWAVLTGLGILMARCFRGRQRRRWRWLPWVPTVAALLDVVENLGLLGQRSWLSPSPPAGSPGALLTWMAGLAAAIKFLLLVSFLFALAVLAIVAFRAWRDGRFRKASTKPLSVPLVTILKAEGAYLASRRRKLAQGLMPESARPVGLAFSGGGIRSATTNLGVLQALGRLGVLPCVDYLSTVSGGGYIGSALSSLLSINRREIRHSGEGESRQYEFAPGDEAYFDTSRERFPFEPDENEQQKLRQGMGQRFDSRVELEHLRTHGDFLIQRQRLIHRDVLRTVGSVFGGLFYHMLLGALAMVVIAAGYLGIVHLMVGSRLGEGYASYLGRPELGRYLHQLFSFEGAGPVANAGPFFHAVKVGLVTIPLLTLVASWVVWSLPERWFRRPGDAVDDNREYHWLWSLFLLTLLFAILVTIDGVKRHDAQLAAITLPMGVYAGGWVAALFFHWVVATWRWPRPFSRNQRSRFAAWKGIYNYLTVISVLVVLVPFVLSWLESVGGPGTGGVVAWLVSLGGSGWLAKSLLGSEKKGGAGAALRLVTRAGAALRNALLGVLVVAVVVLGLLLLCYLILRLEPTDAAGARLLRWGLCLGALLLLSVLGGVLDFNKLSLHYFYRDRLVETYLQTRGRVDRGSRRLRPERIPGSLDLLRDNGEMPLTHLHGVLDPGLTLPQSQRGAAQVRSAIERSLPWTGAKAEDADLPAIEAATSAPLHLLVTCLNLTQSRDLTRRNRKSDAFVFSKLFCGSETTGFMDTRLYRGGETKLARAMTVSGAAANTTMGHHTFFAQALAMTLFNVRLGQWMENPGYRNGTKAFRQEGWVFWPRYLIKEVLGVTDANHRLVQLSDGAHTGDNLGIYPLLLRRCALIVVGDAESDMELGFGSLIEALRQARIDHGIEVDLDLAPVRFDAVSGHSQRPFALGRISYPQTADRPAEKGWLLVVKNSLCDQEGELIREYKKSHPTFPHQTTGDQFFDEAQFEAYRELGERMVLRALGGELRASLIARPGWLRDWKAELPPRFAALAEAQA